LQCQNYLLLLKTFLDYQYMQNLLNDLQELLMQDERFVADGKLLKNKIIECALNLDSELLKELLGNKQLKEHFFVQAGDVIVFDKIKFQKFVSNKQFLADSYTSYKNRIGLAKDGDYLSDCKDVVLQWAYKDCILEGGQSRDEQKKYEVFYNEVLAPNNINRLLDAKVFTNFKRYEQDKVTENPQINQDDNLIIKGNNLLVLHSLKKIKSICGKVKCIFIDPPYNTDNDSFKYNDSFNHSTWLTFMKNRVAVSHDLLSEDGLFWVSLSDHEAHYFKVMTDEIFGRDNFVADVIWNSTKSVTNTAIISGATTHVLLYAKNAKLLKQNRTSFRLTADEQKFSNPDNDPRGKWVADPFQVGGERPNQLYEITNPKTGVVYKPLPGNSWKNEKKVFDVLMSEGRIIFGTKGDAGPQRKRFWSEAKERGEVTTTLWKDLPTTTNGTAHLKELFGDRIFNNPKPEGLIERVLQLSTNEGDLVLDFCLGSGTTCTAAHKMKRRYIGVEQMDYIEEVSIARLKKVLEGEQGGISRTNGWEGGGSFVYCELMKDTQNDIERILGAKDEELLQIFDELPQSKSRKYFIKNLDKEGFLALNSKDKKKILLDCVNKNNLYVNLSEIDDEDYAVSDNDKMLTKRLYSFE